jgi:hypothetical protein
MHVGSPLGKLEGCAEGTRDGRPVGYADGCVVGIVVG